jgi:plasmid stabilization system protein ParE
MSVRVLPCRGVICRRLKPGFRRISDLTSSTRTYAKLFKTFELLAEFPEIGRPRRDVTELPVRFFLTKPYWIVYRDGTPLVIHRVYHAARGLSEINLPGE